MMFNNTKSFIFIFMHAYCSHLQQQKLKYELGDENSFLNTFLNYLRQTIYKIQAKYLYFITKSRLCSGRTLLFSQIFVKTKTKHRQSLFFANQDRQIYDSRKFSSFAILLVFILQRNETLTCIKKSALILHLSCQR